MAVVVNDTFTEASDTTLASHTGETGATWAKHASYAGTIRVIGATDRIRQDAVSGGDAVYYASGTPATAEYDVQASLYVASNVDFAGLCGRIDTAANTYYLVIYYQANGTWVLDKVVAGTATNLGTYTQALTLSQSYTVKLEIRDATKKVYIDGVERISSADNAITAAGKGGVRINASSNSGTDITGYHLDTFSVTDLSGGGSSIAAIARHYMMIGES